MNTPRRPIALMTTAQVICLLAVPLTAYYCLYSAISAFQAYTLSSYSFLIPHLLYLLPSCGDMLIMLCLIWVEIEAFLICGRVRLTSAFSSRNVKALGRIVRVLVIAGAFALVLGSNLIPILMEGLPEIEFWVMHLLLPFILLTLAAMVRTVQVLMRRAEALQEEAALTI